MPMNLIDHWYNKQINRHHIVFILFTFRFFFSRLVDVVLLLFHSPSLLTLSPNVHNIFVSIQSFCVKIVSIVAIINRDIFFPSLALFHSVYVLETFLLACQTSFQIDWCETNEMFIEECHTCTSFAIGCSECNTAYDRTYIAYRGRLKSFYMCKQYKICLQHFFFLSLGSLFQFVLCSFYCPRWKIMIVMTKSRRGFYCDGVPRWKT